MIDCIEIYIERLLNLQACAQTWYNYKNTNTIKYLIAITPVGAVSFLSREWGGRVLLTKKSQCILDFISFTAW